MSKQEYTIIDIAEDCAKFGYSITVFMAKFFYQVSNIETLKNSMDAFMISRFKQRLEYFTFEYDKLSKSEKKSFYEDLKSNKQNQNYLYELVEKSRTSTFDIHAKIYAVISAKLVKNKRLSYFENDLLSYLHLLNEEDIMHLAFILRIVDEPQDYCKNEDSSFKIQVDMFKIPRPIKNLYFIKHNKILFLILKSSHYYTYKKCIQIGIFDDVPIEQNGQVYGVITDISFPKKGENREILVTDNTCFFAELLREIFPSNE